MSQPQPGKGQQPKVNTKGVLGWWADNAVAANLLMIVIVIAGYVGFTRIDQVVMPAVGWNGVSISAAWPGAAPQEIGRASCRERV